jgi:hypothetical protein
MYSLNVRDSTKKELGKFLFTHHQQKVGRISLKKKKWVEFIHVKLTLIKIIHLFSTTLITALKKTTLITFIIYIFIKIDIFLFLQEL